MASFCESLCSKMALTCLFCTPLAIMGIGILSGLENRSCQKDQKDQKEDGPDCSMISKEVSDIANILTFIFLMLTLLLVILMAKCMNIQPRNPHPPMVGVVAEHPQAARGKVGREEKNLEEKIRGPNQKNIEMASWTTPLLSDIA